MGVKVTMPKYVVASVGVLLAVSVGMAAEKPSDTVTLGPKWKLHQADDVAFEWSWHVTKLTTEEGAEPAFVRSTGRKLWGFVQKVQGVRPDGSASFELTLTRAAITIDGPDGRVDYDSKLQDRGGTDPLASMMAKLVGGKIRVDIDPTGKVTELAGLDAIAKKVQGAKYEGPASHHVERLLNKQWLTFILDQHYGAHMFTKVRVGQTWDRTFLFGTHPFKLMYTADHVARQDDRRVAIVTYRHATGKDAGLGEAHGADGHQHTPPDIRGVLTFDVQSGRLLKVAESSLESVIAQKKNDKTDKIQKVETTISTVQSTTVQPRAGSGAPAGEQDETSK